MAEWLVCGTCVPSVMNNVGLNLQMPCGIFCHCQVDWDYSHTGLPTRTLEELSRWIKNELHGEGRANGTTVNTCSYHDKLGPMIRSPRKVYQHYRKECKKLNWNNKKFEILIPWNEGDWDVPCIGNPAILHIHPVLHTLTRSSTVPSKSYSPFSRAEVIRESSLRVRCTDSLIESGPKSSPP